MDINAATKLIGLKNEIEAAAKIISKASIQLNQMGMEARVSGWDWERPGWLSAIAPQGNLVVKIVELQSRPR